MSLFKICSRLSSISICNGITITSNRTYTLKPYHPHEHSIVRNYEDSFQLWVLNKFKDDSNYSTLPENSSINSNDNCKVETLLNTLTSEKNHQTLTPFKLRGLDGAFDSLLTKNSSPLQLLGCLNIFMLTVPIQATKLKCFKSSIYQLERLIKKNVVKTHDIIQGMYYASQFKSSRFAQAFMSVALTKIDEEAMKDLSIVDLSIFCLSLFRSSVPLEKPRILQVLVDHFKKDIQTLINDHPAAFVNFIKCFRISKFVDLDLIRLISSQNLDRLDIVAKTHLSIYFAISRYSDIDFVAKYLISCVQESNSRIVNGVCPRLKDFDNLIWACGNFNIHEVNQIIGNSSVPIYVKDSLAMIRREPQSQVALLLWLWICGCRLEEEVVRWVTLENTKSIIDSTNFKSVANLFLLLSCVQIESPNLLKPQIINLRDKRLQPNYEQYINKRPSLKRLIKLILNQTSNLKLTDAHFSFQVPGLYIGGISVQYEGKVVDFEVIDETVSLANSSELNGKMKLKLRLLEKMGHSIIQVPADSAMDVIALRKQLETI